MRRREHGQVLPLLTLVIVVAGGLCLAAGRLGGAAVDEARAATAADAAALAAAAAGPGAAAEVAAANGARLSRVETAGTDTRVSVEVGAGATASARARRSAPERGGPAPALRAALARAAQLVGAAVPVVAPPPGETALGDAVARHGRGLAVDVQASFVATLVPVAARAGLCRPYPEAHPTHFELCSWGAVPATTLSGWRRADGSAG